MSSTQITGVQAARPAGAAPESGTASSSLGAIGMAFTATLFLSAFLLFSVQPMFTKMILPVLGGSPAVWSVAMVFFQGLLLAGYLWAHLLTRHLSPTQGVAAHLLFTALALACVPISAAAAADGPPEHGQALWLMGVFALAVGAPFFALSANGPLLQAWFARSGHARAHDPYFLYGASNIGSFAALLAYPLLFEPLSGLSQQSRWWAFGFLALLAALGGCAALVRASALRAGADVATPVMETPAARAPVTRRSGTFLAWVGLAAAPSGLLVSVTAHISTDIAAAPLLWVLPLALYLLTFVLAFRDRPAIPDGWLAPAQIVASLLVLLLIGMRSAPLLIALALHLVYFFIAALGCHRALYRLRPGGGDLTAFYLAMSVGGLIGGLFAGLAAPHLFSSVLEYPILIVAALFCMPGFAQRVRAASWNELVASAALAGGVLAAGWFAAGRIVPLDLAYNLTPAILGAVAIASWRAWPRVGVFAIATALAVTVFQQGLAARETHRSFFGVHKVREVVLDGTRLRILEHGTTMHGAMRLDADASAPPQPTTYYAFAGPIGEALSSARAAQGGRLARIDAVGLGVGTLACHRRADETISFFEIDPIVVDLARDAARFRFLSHCAPDARIVLGDARLTLARETASANAIVIDAFSSDAIPVHLLTREAVALYRSKLADNGVLIFHISNNTMDLSRIVAGLAQANGLVAYLRVDVTPPGENGALRASSIAVAMAREPAHLGALATSGAWRRLEADPAGAVWTDDYSTILTPILARLRPR